MAISPARSHKVCERRLCELVFQTVDITIAQELGIQRSTSIDRKNGKFRDDMVTSLYQTDGVP